MSATIATAPLAGAEQVALREAWGHELVALADRYPQLLVLDGDLANSTRADIFAAAVPDRFFELGIAEQNLLGVAAGLATVGFVPWISTFTAFLASRALDQIRVVIAQTHLDVKLCGSYSGLLTGKTGKTHQAVDDLAIFRSTPGMTVIAPADAVELRAAMAAMMETPGPTYLRLTRDPSPVIFPPDHRFAIGAGVLLRGGDDVGLIGTGTQTIRVLAAAVLGERPRRFGLGGAGTAMAGVAAVTLPSGDGLRVPGAGDALVLASAGCFAIFAVLGRRAFPADGTLPVLVGMAAWGTAGLVPATSERPEDGEGDAEA